MQIIIILVEGMLIQRYGETRFVDLKVCIIIVLYNYYTVLYNYGWMWNGAR